MIATSTFFIDRQRLIEAGCEYQCEREKPAGETQGGTRRIMSWSLDGATSSNGWLFFYNLIYDETSCSLAGIRHFAPFVCSKVPVSYVRLLKIVPEFFR